MSATWTMREWLDAYGASHQNPTNKIIHWICVPLIFLTIVGLLWSIPLPSFFPVFSWLNFATMMLIPVIFFYARLSTQLAIGMIIWCLFCFLICFSYESIFTIPIWIPSLIIFFLAWVGQFLGHKIEGVKPSFFEDLQFLMIGPAWLMSFLYDKFRIKY